MVGSVGKASMDLREKLEPLPEEFDPKEISVPVDSGPNGGLEAGDGKNREIVLGRNVHKMCFAINEPEADDEVTGEREAYMASVLARYRKSLIERTKHHLGMICFFFYHMIALFDLFGFFVVAFVVCLWSSGF